LARWDAVRAEIERIRRRTDDRIACDRRRIEAFYYGAPEREHNAILAKVLRRDCEEEDRELSTLGSRLSPRAKRLVFDETLENFAAGDPPQGH
jgi:hypothetical protein